MSNWKTAPTHTIAGISELDEQLLPTKQIKRRIGHQMQDVWKGAGVDRTCAVKLQCISTDEVSIKTQRNAQNTFL